MRGGGGGFGGGGFSGPMGGMRGLQTAGMHAASVDNLTDDNIVGKVYDNRVVTRLLTYVKSFKKEAFITVCAVLLYTLGNVFIPYMAKEGIEAVGGGDEAKKASAAVSGVAVQEGSSGAVTGVAVLESSGEAANGVAVEEGGGEVASGNNVRRLHIVGIIFLAVVLVHFGSNYLQMVFMPKVGQGVLYLLRTQMFNHLQSLSPAFFHRTEVGRIVSRSQSDVLQLQETFDLMVESFADLLSLFGIMAVMLFIDWQLALVCLSIVPVLLLLLVYWQKFARHSFMRIRRAVAMVNGEYNQNITGVRVVESFNRQEVNLKHFDSLNREHLDANLEASKFSGGLMPVVGTLVGLGMGFGVVLVGGLLAADGLVEWAILVSFAMYIQRFFEPIRHLTMQYSQLQRAMAAGVRIFEILDLRPEVTDRPGAPAMPPLQGHIRFEGVGFHYVPGVKVLDDVNVDIKPGENVALVGSTGAGKSTMVTLIHRFADVTEGRITVDGYDIRDVKRHSLVSQMSMVLQEPYLFSGTIRDNIRYSHEEASDEDVVAAAKGVGAHDFIMGLDGGYNNVLAERGVNLSVGQRQLLSFARAIVGNPRVIILDEATASIDTQTELLIQDALKRILLGRTSIVIAHRLSTVRNADKILVLDHGRLVETGNHQELLKLNGVYARLYAVNYGLHNGNWDTPGGDVPAPAPAGD